MNTVACTERPLRVFTFNVNGLRAFLARRYGKTATITHFLSDLGANLDIICLQETKLRREELAASRELALSAGWESFFSCDTTKDRGYSGTATFCRADVCMPFAAEEGFSGCAPPTARAMSLAATATATAVHPALLPFFSEEELQELDSEGRVVITDHGCFVLFNIYAPAITNPETAEQRQNFKRRFFSALQLRWEALLQQGRAVMAVGDFNIAPAPLDYPDHDPDFYRKSRPDRIWLRSLLQPNQQYQGVSVSAASFPSLEATISRPSLATGRFLDVFRVYHRTRKDAYTVWNTATDARKNNYGSRIDLIITAGLSVGTHQGVVNPLQPGHQQPPNAAADIDTGCGDSDGGDELNLVPRPKETESGHAALLPMVAVLEGCDVEPEIQGSDHCPVWVNLGCFQGHERAVFPKSCTPPGCAMSTAYPGKQVTLHQWLAKTDKLVPTAAKTPPSRADAEGNQQQLVVEAAGGLGTQAQALLGSIPMTSGPGSSSGVSAKPVGKQLPLRSFFRRPAPPAASASASAASSAGDGGPKIQEELEVEASEQTEPPPGALQQQQQGSIDSEFLKAEVAASEASRQAQHTAAKSAWSFIQQRMKTPKCHHGEPAALKKVNKTGPNHGRYFYTCARPDGKGPEGQCSFFSWVEPKPGDQSWKNKPGANNNKASSSAGGAKRQKL